MGLGSKVNDRRRLVSLQQLSHQRSVADVADDQLILIGSFWQRIAVAGVGQLVEINNPHIATSDRASDEATANETGAACDQKSLHI